MRCARALVLLAVAWSWPLQSVLAQDQAERGLVEVMSSAEVPYALRVDSLLRYLDQVTGRSDKSPDAFLENHGIAPDSAAADELIALAQQIGRAHPVAVPEDVQRDFRMKDDDAGFQAWQQARVEARAAAVGTGFGQWLLARQQEGYPVGPVIDRLLNSGAMTVSFSSTDAEPVWRAALDARCDRFDQGLQQSLGRLPSSFVRNGGM